MNENWRTIRGYEGFYEVSTLGRVRNSRTRRILSPQRARGGYLFVQLCRPGQCKPCKIHRLVATAFLENPNNFPQVNHKNGNTADNRVSNLEWCSQEYNIWHEHRVLGKNNKATRRVLCVETNEVFSSHEEAAAKVGVSKQMISFACCGRRKTAKGYHWKYLD